ncbi:DNA-binding domain-containing protein [Microvirga aerophila]|uniref:DNA-binding domain-containing protein n=1 Tax=Microvirga aerophila TaxID=670291 RepID=UPI000DEF606A
MCHKPAAPADRHSRGRQLNEPEVEKLIAEQIECFWLRRERPTLKALIERVHDACRVAGLRPPNRRTIQRRVNELDLQKTARRRGEGDALAKVTPSPGSYTADGSNEVWQIDHIVVGACHVIETAWVQLKHRRQWIGSESLVRLRDSSRSPKPSQ